MTDRVEFVVAEQFTIRGRGRVTVGTYSGDFGVGDVFVSERTGARLPVRSIDLVCSRPPATTIPVFFAGDPDLVAGDVLRLVERAPRDET